MHLLTRVLTTTTLFSTPPTRLPPACMLLGADGLPMKKAGDASSTAAPSAEDKKAAALAMDAAADAIKGSSGGLSSIEMPEDLKDFDPTFDPLAAKAPKYDFCAASGRPDEPVWGAMAAGEPGELGEWAKHMKSGGMTRVLGLFTAEDAGARSTAGTPEGYFQELVAAGPFEEANVGLIDPRSVGARDAVLNVLRQTQEAREKICIHCADGHKLTAIVLSDWLLTDYIGGGSENMEEARDLLAARKRLAGVGRFADLEELERWVADGHL